MQLFSSTTVLPVLFECLAHGYENLSAIALGSTSIPLRSLIVPSLLPPAPPSQSGICAFENVTSSSFRSASPLDSQITLFAVLSSSRGHITRHTMKHRRYAGNSMDQTKSRRKEWNHTLDIAYRSLALPRGKSHVHSEQICKPSPYLHIKT